MTAVPRLRNQRIAFSTLEQDQNLPFTITADGPWLVTIDHRPCAKNADPSPRFQQRENIPGGDRQHQTPASRPPDPAARSPDQAPRVTRPTIQAAGPGTQVARVQPAGSTPPASRKEGWGYSSTEKWIVFERRVLRQKRNEAERRSGLPLYFLAGRVPWGLGPSLPFVWLGCRAAALILSAQFGVCAIALPRRKRTERAVQ